MHHTTIAIVGWSFAGLSALLVLRKRLGKKVHIKLFDERSHFCHIPALHEAVLHNKARLDSMQIDFSKYYPDEYVQARIESITSNTLTTKSGITRTFDYCIIATGSRTNFFENEKRETNAYAIRYADDLEAINKKLLDPKTKTISIVGGGYTGVEIASIIALRKRSDQQICMIHSRERLFERLGMYISKTALNRLQKHDVEILLNARVADIENDAIQLTNGQKLVSDMTIVSRGIKVNDESFHPHLSFNDQYQANDADHIYLCGDIAKHGLIATAHNAMFEWRRTGHLIADKIQNKNKHYPPLQNRDKLAIALGPHDGILTNGSKWIYIPYLVGFAKRIIERRVLFEFKRKIMLWI